MAVDYTLTFTRLGRYVAETNLWLARQASQLLNADVGADDILDEFNANRDLADGVLDLYLGAQSDLKRLVSGLNSKAQTLLGSLQADLSAPNASMQTLIPLLVERMVDDSQTIKANSITAPVVVATSSNVGNGGLSCSRLNADGVNDESAISEVVKVRCTQDRFNGGTAGSEVFEIVGKPKVDKEDGYNARGSGNGPKLLGGAASNLILNGAFTSFSSNAPSSWNVTAGVVGTDILESTTVFHAYANSLELKSGGAINITLNQTLQGVTAKKVNVANIWVRRSGGSWSAGGLLTFVIKGTGMSDKTVLSLDPATLTASFANYVLFFASPASLPSDLRVELAWSGANLNAAKSVYLSGSSLRLATIHAGTAYALFRGSADFLKDDDFSVTTASDYAGKFQTWCTRFLGHQLPSAGSPTISDSLAA